MTVAANMRCEGCKVGPEDGIVCGLSFFVSSQYYLEHRDSIGEQDRVTVDTADVDLSLPFLESALAERRVLRLIGSEDAIMARVNDLDELGKAAVADCASRYLNDAPIAAY